MKRIRRKWLSTAALALTLGLTASLTLTLYLCAKIQLINARMDLTNSQLVSIRNQLNSISIRTETTSSDISGTQNASHFDSSTRVRGLSRGGANAEVHGRTVVLDHSSVTATANGDADSQLLQTNAGPF